MSESSTLDKIWQAVLGEMELEYGKANFATWFSNTSMSALEDLPNEQAGKKAIVSVPNNFIKDWLEDKYNKKILASLRNFCTHVSQIEYIIGQSKPKISPKNKKEAGKKNSSAKSINSNLRNHHFSQQERTGLNPRYTFDSFVVGGNTALAEAAARAVSDEPGEKYNPLFIYGGVGLGKTHLLQAIGNQILDQGKGSKVKYISAENFANELVGSIRKREVTEFKEKYRKIEILLIDDIQFIGGKEKTQEEFFHTFNTLYQSGRQIVICSDRPPREIATLEERLCSRFEGGMMADISQPDLETRIAILDAKARDLGVSLEQDVLGYIASNVQNNIRELEGALNKFIASCQIQDWEFNLRSAKLVLASMVSASQRQAITPQHIVRKVARFFNLKTEDLMGTSRRSEIVKPRQIAIYLMRKESNFSYPAIGSFLKKDHSTIMHSANKIKDALKRDETVLRELNAVRDYLYRKNS
ncbi:MAG: chromosomal replication initiator protein DnaA [Candidatus Moraniibacteriota bacterium]